MEMIDYILPNWTLCPLFNNDYSGTAEGDIRLLNDFLARERLGSPLDCEELGFC